MAIITGKTKIFGVIGNPIEHSLSPVMHNAVLSLDSFCTARHGLNYVYLPFSVPATQLTSALAGLEVMGCRGFNVTIPYKQAIIPFLHTTTAIAKTVGAVNTVWRTEQGWSGTNTDVQGFLAPLHNISPNWGDQTVTLLGSGGAARAVLAGCLELGVKTIHIVGRSPDKCQTLCNDFSPLAPLVKFKALNWAQLSECLPETHLLVNTTPIGMSPDNDRSPVDAATLAHMPNTGIVYDLIYNPNPTLLLQTAQTQCKTALDGLEMLVQQGAAALEIWLGQPVPAHIMRSAAEAQLFGSAPP